MIEDKDFDAFALKDGPRLPRFEEHLVRGRIFRARLLRWWTVRARRRFARERRRG